MRWVTYAFIMLGILGSWIMLWAVGKRGYCDYEVRADDITCLIASIVCYVVAGVNERMIENESKT